LGAVYKLLDIFVQVSIDKGIESFGQTYVEALAAEVPSVFSLSGIANDFIRDNKNAFVVPYKNSQAIAENFLFILQNQEKARSVAKQGYIDVQQEFSLEKMIHSLENLYEQ
jgi:glycosyltransferase involved in cell wall biosynthesis